MCTKKKPNYYTIVIFTKYIRLLYTVRLVFLK